MYFAHMLLLLKVFFNSFIHWSNVYLLQMWHESEASVGSWDISLNKANKILNSWSLQTCEQGESNYKQLSDFQIIRSVLKKKINNGVIQNDGKAPLMCSASDWGIRGDCPERVMFALRTDYPEKSCMQSSEGKACSQSKRAKSLRKEQIGVFVW